MLRPLEAEEEQRSDQTAAQAEADEGRQAEFRDAEDVAAVGESAGRLSWEERDRAGRVGGHGGNSGEDQCREGDEGATRFLTEPTELDAVTQRHLELVETERTRERAGSLLGTVDRTVTAMGRRMLRGWLLRPLSIWWTGRAALVEPYWPAIAARWADEYNTVYATLDECK